MKKEIAILVAEDSPNDVILIQRALGNTIPEAKLLVVENGAKAIAHLSGEGEYSDRKRFPMPDIVLADMIMPNGDGFALLEWIRSHPQFMKLPVIIMSGAALPDHVKQMLSKGANAFIYKDNLVDDPPRFAARVLSEIERL